METYEDIFNSIYEKINNNEDVLIEITLIAEGVKWDNEKIVLSSGQAISLNDYAKELRTEYSKLLSDPFKIVYNELQDKFDISYSIDLKRNCLLEIIGLSVSLYKELSAMEKIIIASLLTSYVTGFLALGFYRVKKDKYLADKEVEKHLADIELEKEKIKYKQLEIQERLIASSKKSYKIAQQHKEKLVQDLNTGEIFVYDNPKINQFEGMESPHQDDEQESSRPSM